MAELKQAIAAHSVDESAWELGDVFFTLANLARHLHLNAEDTLRETNHRFRSRFQYIEDQLAARGLVLTKSR